VCLRKGLQSIQSDGYQDLRFIAPNMVSIDGQSQPKLFRDYILPWMLQSPIFPAIGLLMSATTQSLTIDGDRTMNPEIISLRARVFMLINKFMSGQTEDIGNELIGAIINLVVLEASQLPFR